MKERICLEWIILCELARARKRYGLQVDDDFIAQEAETLARDYAMLEDYHGTLPRWSSVVKETSAMAVSGRVISGRELNALNLKAWYRSGGQF